MLSSGKVKSKDGIVYENEPIKPDINISIEQGYEILLKWLKEFKE